MNEEQKAKLMNAAIDLLTKSITLIDNGIDFAKEQVPLFVTEFVKYTLYESVVLGTICLVFTILGVLCLIHLWNKTEPDDWHDGPKPYIRVVMVVAGCICFFVTVHYYNKAIKAAVAPRVLLFDTVKDWAQEKQCQNRN